MTAAPREQSPLYYNAYVTTPISVRFDSELLHRLRQRADSIPGATPSGLVQRLVDEGLRMAEHPEVVFVDGPAGRRPALKVGPDVWELVKFLREIDERGTDAVAAAAEVFAVPEGTVRAGLRYYTAHPDEVDRWIADAEEVSAAAERAWLAEQDVLR